MTARAAETSTMPDQRDALGQIGGLLARGGPVLAAAMGIAGGAVLGISAYSAHNVVRPNRNWQPAEWQPPVEPVLDVTFPNRAGLGLSGWLLPPQPGQTIAIICHGFGTNRREGQDLLPWLFQAGYGALLFDFQGHGESQGKSTTVGLREVDDLLSAVRYLQGRFGAGVPLVVVGFSMGGSVAIMAAAQELSIRAVLADSAFASLRRAVARSFRVFFRLPPWLFARPTIWFAEQFSGGKIGEVIPLNAAAAISPRPLYLVQGTEDAIVDPDDLGMLYAAAVEPKQLWQVPNAGHVQARNLHPEMYRQLVLTCLRVPFQTMGQPAEQAPETLAT